MNIKQSKFHCGQNVRVVEGTKDPDYGTDIGGWSGSVEDILPDKEGNETWLYMILWDKRTLRKMGRKVLRRCEKDNLDYTRMCLGESELVALP